MNEEARQKIKDLLNWMYERHYITSNNIEDNVNFTPLGSRFMADTFGENWDIGNWTNLGDSTSIWLPYPGFERWDYAWTADWELHKEEYDSRLDLFINAIGADILVSDDYIELDDIVL